MFIIQCEKCLELFGKDFKILRSRCLDPDVKMLECL